MDTGNVTSSDVTKTQTAEINVDPANDTTAGNNSQNATNPVDAD
jgi:hypothetical protein